MTTKQTSKLIRDAAEASILAKWSQPNEIRKAGLNRNGFSWEEADRYDRLERRESTLLELFDERPLSAAETEELKTIQQALWEMDEAVRARKKTVTFASAAAA